MELYRTIGDYLFVHAGIKPEVPLDKQNPQDLMRIRERFSDYAEPHEYKVVHGHQITQDVVVKPNRVGVDTGFYEQGVLSCVVLEKQDIEILQVQQDIQCQWKSPKNH